MTEHYILPTGLVTESLVRIWFYCAYEFLCCTFNCL